MGIDPIQQEIKPTEVSTIADDVDVDVAVAVAVGVAVDLALEAAAARKPIDEAFFELEVVHESVDKAKDTIGRRVKKSVALVIGLLFIVAAIDGYAVSVVTHQASSIASVYRELITADQQVLVSAVATDLAIRSFLLSGDPAFVSALEVARPELERSIAELERVAVEVGDPGLLQLVSTSSSIVSIWLTTFVNPTTKVASTDTPRGDQLAGAELINSLRISGINISTYIDDVNDKALVAAQRVRQQTIAAAAAVLVLAFLVIAVLLIVSASDISYPLIGVSRVVNRLYGGESSARADDEMGPAEIRAVARAVNELAFQQETAHKWVSKFNLAKTNFLNTINHELRSPLTSISGYSELLGDDDELSKTERDHMATAINRNAFRLNDLIDNMLTVLRIDSLEVRFKMTIFDIRDVIKESVDWFQALAHSNDLTIVTDLGDVALMVKADESGVLRVIHNIVSNAVKFSLPGGLIEISAGRVTSTGGKSEVVLSVKDSGIGIVEGELPFVGSRFYRSTKSVAAAIPGMGLGLMIVDFIVREHGGSWSLISSELSGTTVEVRLPLAGDEMLLDLTGEDSLTSI